MKIFTLLLLLCAFCSSQPARQSAPAEVPVDKEPHHHLVFENEYVRVFKVEVLPHEATLVHRHSRDYVVVTIGDADVTNAVVGKEPKRWSFKDGDVTFLEASGEKSFAHKAVNESEKPFVNLTIELKKHWNTELRPCAEPFKCERKIKVGDLVVGTTTSVFTNGFVSAYRYQLFPGGTLNANFYSSRDNNFVFIAALTDLEGNFGGIEEQIPATRVFGTDGRDMEITAPRDRILRWILLRFSYPK